MASKLAAAAVLALALASVLPATAARPRPGSFSGTTEQGRAITFEVTRGGGKVKELEVGYRGKCDNGSGIVGTLTFTRKFRVNDGFFSARRGKSRLTGEFTKRKRARGTFRWRSGYVDPITGRSVSCSTRPLRWTARR